MKALQQAIKDSYETVYEIECLIKNATKLLDLEKIELELSIEFDSLVESLGGKNDNYIVLIIEKRFSNCLNRAEWHNMKIEKARFLANPRAFAEPDSEKSPKVRKKGGWTRKPATRTVAMYDLDENNLWRTEIVANRTYWKKYF